MKIFLTILRHDFRRFFERKRLITVCVFILLAALSVIPGLKSSKAELKQVREYGQVEAERFRELETFKQFLHYGVDFFYAPSPLADLLAPQIGKIDVVGNFGDGSQLRIITPIAGVPVSRIWVSPFNTTVILFYIGVLLALFLGADITRFRDYMRHMSGILGFAKSYWYFALARIIVLSVILLVIFVAMLIVILSHGFILLLNNMGCIAAYYLTVWLTLVFALGVGLILGSIYHGKIEKVLTPLFLTWIFMVFMIPSVIYSIRELRVQPRYMLEAERVHILNGFKQKVHDELGEPTEANREQYKERWAAFMQNEYPQIEAMDNGIKQEIAVNNALNRKLSQFTPMSFFIESIGELGGIGRDNLISFYDYLQERKREYWQFVLSKVFGGKEEIPVPFKEGHVFYAKSRLPGNFAGGVLTNLVIIVLTLLLGFVLHNRGICHVGKEIKADRINIKLKQRGLMTFTIHAACFRRLFLNVFMGKVNMKKFPGKLSMEDENIVTRKKKEFFLLPPPSGFPGENKVKDIIQFYKSILDALNEEVDDFKAGLSPEVLEERFKNLDWNEKALVVLRIALLKPCPVYILMDIAEEVPEEFYHQLREEVDRMKTQSLVIDLLSMPLRSWHTKEDALFVVVRQDGFYQVNDITKPSLL